MTLNVDMIWVWAYITASDQNRATCKTCGKKLKGEWCIGKNGSNKSNGRTLGISDAYFLSGDQPNLVYSYCKSCWKKEIQEILPKLGINVASDNSKKELNQAKEIIEKQKIIINQKEEELKHLKLELKKINGKKKVYVEVDKMMTVNFISTDQMIHFSVPCIGSNTFAEVEEKLYEQFPEYRETNNLFVANGKQILRFKTISENKIGNGLPVTMLTS